MHQLVFQVDFIYFLLGVREAYVLGTCLSKLRCLEDEFAHMKEHSQAEGQTTHLQSLRGVDVRAGLRPRTRDMRISAGWPSLHTRRCHLFRW